MAQFLHIIRQLLLVGGSLLLLEVAAMVGHTPQLALRPYANGRVVPPPPPPLPVASFLTVGFVASAGLLLPSAEDFFKIDHFSSSHFQGL